ncbi:MAG: RNA pyrophosphohydrolase [Nanoarchaeota archaeon]|nr:RNA pyrophosphohydrolase [Nanoarchaeota archaeon]
MAEHFRETVAAIIINKDKQILMCEHIWIDNAWQFPQGGVEEGESGEEALKRELYEEIGTRKIKIIKKMPNKVTYKFPFYLKSKYQIDGQIQTYFLVYFYGEDSDIVFDKQSKPEFKKFQWVKLSEPPKKVIYFKKLAYLEAIKYFKNEIEKFDPANY